MASNRGARFVTDRPPFTQHCKTLKPTLEKVSKTFENEGKVGRSVPIWRKKFCC